MRAAQQGNPHKDLFLTGLAASQFIEGASRWSIAPLFHKREEEKRDKNTHAPNNEAFNLSI
jgi:hypothetical protein